MSNQQNELFLADPRAYLAKISVQNPFNLGGAVKVDVDLDAAHAKLVMNLRPIDAGWFSAATKVAVEVGDKPDNIELNGDVAVTGGWVPYHNEGMVKEKKAEIGKLSIPKAPSVFEPKFVFTGAMNGCSFVLAEDYKKDLWAVHYPNSSGAKNDFPLLNDAGLTLVKSINYETTKHGEGYGETATCWRRSPSSCGRTPIAASITTRSAKNGGSCASRSW